MAGRIPQAFIDDLLARVDIIDVIDSRVPLKKAGREYKACCPFHDEKTPSFTVSSTKQFYHCFGCGAHGTAISFLMEYENLAFPEAIEELAHRVGLEVPKSADPIPQAQRENTTSLFAILERADRFFQAQLRQHPAAEKAVEYLKQRGLSGEIARDFGIGYAPDGWDNLLKAMADVKPKDLETAGLLIARDNGGFYDRFRDRVMFPIRNRSGKVIGFGGRVLEADAKGAKYLNSPETPVFHKGKELYGFYEARQAIRQLSRLMVVEGYMDVVALAQHGIRYAVASLGTALTRDHLTTLFRTVSDVVFCFDGDRAGRDAAWRSLETALPMMAEGRRVSFLFLPNGEDPDTLVRQIGQEKFEQLIDKAQPLADFMVDQLSRNADLGRVDGRARLVDMAKPLINQVPQGAYRHLLLEQLAARTRIDDSELATMLGDNSAGNRPKSPASQRFRPQQSWQAPSQVRHAISLLLQQPQLARATQDVEDLADLPLPGVILLVELVELLQHDPHLTTAGIIERFRQREEGKYLGKLAGHPVLLGEDDDIEQEFLDTLNQLRRQRKEQRLKILTGKSFKDLSDNEKIELQQLLSQ